MLTTPASDPTVLIMPTQEALASSTDLSEKMDAEKTLQGNPRAPNADLKPLSLGHQVSGMPLTFLKAGNLLSH